MRWMDTDREETSQVIFVGRPRECRHLSKLMRCPQHLSAIPRLTVIVVDALVGIGDTAAPPGMIDIAYQHIDKLKGMIGLHAGFVALGATIIVIGGGAERYCSAIRQRNCFADARFLSELARDPLHRGSGNRGVLLHRLR